MKQGEKLLIKLRGKRFANWSIKDFRTLLEHLGFTYSHTTGSHEFWNHPVHRQMNIQAKGGQAKPYQLRQLLKQIQDTET